MKKLAMIQMGTYYEPEKHRILFQTEELDSLSCTVRNMEEAEQLVLKLYEEGFRVVELCGAFGEENARRLQEVTGGKMLIGYVVMLSGQEEMSRRFWSGEDELMGEN